MIAEGQYLATPQSPALGQSSKGTDQLVVQFRIDEGPQKGQLITWYGYLSENTAERTIKAMRTMGWQGNDFANLQTMKNQVRIVIGHEEYKDKQIARVQWINPRDGAPVKQPLDASATRMLSSKFAHLVKAIPPVPVQHDITSRDSDIAREPGSDDDIGDDFDGDSIPF